jgi:5'(3')-deoxyribonucleotidase
MDWAIWDSWGVPKGAWERIFREGVNQGRIWRYGNLIEGALEGLWELSDAEYHIRIVTHRLNHKTDFRVAVESTAAWLDEQVIPYRSIAIVGEGDPKSNYKAEVLLDDGPHNITDWLARTWDTAIVFDRPWNQDIDVPVKSRMDNGDIPALHRAIGWPEAVETIRTVVGL